MFRHSSNVIQMEQVNVPFTLHVTRTFREYYILSFTNLVSISSEQRYERDYY